MSALETVCFRIESAPADFDRLVAELYALGTLGIQEEEDALLAYFAVDTPPGPILALGDGERIRVLAPTRVPPRDWEREWRMGLAPRRIGPLWVRPSWCASPGEPELCIDPEQAFGSGEHATTRLALEMLLGVLRPGDRVLDVGSGSGILGLAALRMGAGTALGFDLERAACLNAGGNARRNALPMRMFCGTFESLAPGLRFDVVVSNMLLRELRGVFPRLARCTARHLVLSGTLERERPVLTAAVEALGLERIGEAREAQSGDVWWASLWRQSSSSSASVASNS